MTYPQFVPENRDPVLKQEEGSSRIFTEYRLIEDKVRAGVSRGDLRVVLTDIDATLVLGSGHHECEVAESHGQARQLITELNQQGSIIVPVTGSHFESATNTTASVLNRIQSRILPTVGWAWRDDLFHVDAYVSAGGARAVFSEESGVVDYDQRYQQGVRPNNLDYQRIVSEALRLARGNIEQELSPIEWSLVRDYDKNAGEERIYFQEGTASGRHREGNKVALYFYASSLDDRDRIESHYATVMSRFNLKVVCCEEKDANSHARRTIDVNTISDGFPFKYCLDIVPYNKASAADYFLTYVNHLIAEQRLERGVPRPDIEVWACGDSGNDFPLMAAPAVSHCVMVGGMSEELLRLSGRLRELGKLVYVESDTETLGPASIRKALANPHLVQ